MAYKALPVGEFADKINLNRMLNRANKDFAPLASNWEFKRAAMWHINSLVTAGNALDTIHSSPMPYGYESRQNTPANADSFTNGCYVSAGTYELFITYRQSIASGIIEFRIDGNLVGTVDGYAGSSTPVSGASVGTIVLAAGWHELEGLINGKNASSSDFFFFGTKFWLKQASD